MDKGYISLWRSIQDNEMWFEEPFTRAQAWIDMLLLANHKKTSMRVRGIKLEVDRGQIGRAKETLGERWKWSRSKVMRFLNELENEGMIEQQTSIKNSRLPRIISIINYEKYQQSEQQKNFKKTLNEQQKDTNNNVNKPNNENKKEKDANASKKSETINFDGLGLNSEQLKDLKEIRKKTKAANTQRSIDSLAIQFQKAYSLGYEPDQILNAMHDKSWRGFKVDWLTNANIKPQEIEEHEEIQRDFKNQWNNLPTDAKELLKQQLFERARERRNSGQTTY